MAAGKHPAAWSRLMRRLIKPFLSEAEKDRIAAAIAAAEKTTTGEIHVHVIARSGGRDLLHIARAIFHELGMQKTKRRNAVLILISHLDHRFAIYGDQGIHDQAGQRLWDEAAGVLRGHFLERRYADGVADCVAQVGRELAKHFPPEPGSSGDDELPNEVTQS